MKKLLIIGFSLLVSSLSLVACAPPAATTPAPTTAPAAAGSSGGAASEVADLAARNERLTAAYTETIELLRRSAQGENVDAAVARLPDPADLAPPTRVDSRSHRRHSRSSRTAAAAPAATPAPAAAPAPEDAAPTGPEAAAPVAPLMGSFANGPATTTFRDPVRNVIGNVAFNNGPTPWQQDGAMIGRSEVTVILNNMTTAVQVIVNGRQVCVSTGGEFLQVTTTSGRRICVVPPAPNRAQNIRFLAGDEGSEQEIILQRYSYNSYRGGVVSFRGNCSHTMVPGDDLTGVWSTNDYLCH